MNQQTKQSAELTRSLHLVVDEERRLVRAHFAPHLIELHGFSDEAAARAWLRAEGIDA